MKINKAIIAVLLILTVFYGCSKDTPHPPSLSACFVASSTRVGPGGADTFTNCSTGATSYTWNFGDGSSTSTAYNVVHTFQNPGAYNVLLTAYSASQTDTYSFNITVGIAYVTPEAIINTQGFTFNPRQRVACDGSESLYASYYLWNFGNGKTATTDTASTSYSLPGTYTISLTVYSQNKLQSNTIKENITIL